HLQTIESVSYRRLKLANQFQHFPSKSLQRILSMFVDNENFKRESLELYFETIDDQTERDNIIMFRSLPPMDRLNLIWTNNKRLHFTRPEIDSSTLIGLVEKVNNVNFSCAQNTIDAQNLLNVFRIVCGSTEDRRVRIMAKSEHYHELVEILLRDSPFERKAKGWWRDRESGAVLFCGKSYVGYQTLTFMKSSIGYEDVDNGEYHWHLPDYYR
ncbi:hypothetical protein PFISCL1PPCAC_11708, partial [Pristionchus fissidentatus]